MKMRIERSLRRLRGKPLYIVVFAAMLILTSVISTFALSDVGGRADAKEIEDWVNKGYMNAYADGSFRPEAAITRAEFVYSVYKAFKVPTYSNMVFADIDKSNPYFNAIASCVGIGYISGYSDGTFRAESQITREEVATILCRVMRLPGDPAGADRFIDANLLNWSKGFVGSVVRQNIMRGFADETFQPKRTLSRAEAVGIMKSALSSYNSRGYGQSGDTKTAADTSGVYTGDMTISGDFGPASGTDTMNANLTVQALQANTVIQNLMIKGNLDITSGSGNIELRNVTVTGTLTMSGGSALTLKNTVIKDLVISNSRAGSVTLDLTSVVYLTWLHSSVTLNAPFVDSATYGFRAVNVPKGKAPAGAAFNFYGFFKNVAVDANGTSLFLQSGAFGSLIISETAKSTGVVCASGTSVNKAEIRGESSAISGSGTLGDFAVYAAGVTLSSRPRTITGTYANAYNNYNNGYYWNYSNGVYPYYYGQYYDGRNYYPYDRYTGSVRIRVADREGYPVSGASVSLSRSIYGTTNSDGYVDFSDVPSGTYTAYADKDGYSAASKTITVNTSYVTETLTLNWYSRKVDLAFVVYDDTNGHPIRGAVVDFGGSQVSVSNAQGHAFINGLEPGRNYSYAVYASGYESHTASTGVLSKDYDVIYVPMTPVAQPQATQPSSTPMPTASPTSSPTDTPTASPTTTPTTPTSATQPTLPPATQPPTVTAALIPPPVTPPPAQTAVPTQSAGASDTLTAQTLAGAQGFAQTDSTAAETPAEESFSGKEPESVTEPLSEPTAEPTVDEDFSNSTREDLGGAVPEPTPTPEPAADDAPPVSDEIREKPITDFDD